MNTATRSTYAKLQMASAHMQPGQTKSRYVHIRRDKAHLFVMWWGRPHYGVRRGVRAYYPGMNAH